jgi:hypothetical protein
MYLGLSFINPTTPTRTTSATTAYVAPAPVTTRPLATSAPANYTPYTTVVDVGAGGGARYQPGVWEPQQQAQVVYVETPANVPQETAARAPAQSGNGKWLALGALALLALVLLSRKQRSKQ